MKLTFRNGVYAGLGLALVVGIYLFQLWQPERQIELHSQHLIDAVVEKDWADVAEFIDATYQDQWGQDRALLLARLREVVRYLRNLRIESRDTIALARTGEGSWRARLTVEADPNELTVLIKERVNQLAEPWELQWRQQSRKPWDWKLVRIENPSFELPDHGL